jgi:hypothetical protein
VRVVVVGAVRLVGVGGVLVVVEPHPLACVGRPSEIEGAPGALPPQLEAGGGGVSGTDDLGGLPPIEPSAYPLLVTPPRSVVGAGELGLAAELVGDLAATGLQYQRPPSFAHAVLVGQLVPGGGLSPGLLAGGLLCGGAVVPGAFVSCGGAVVPGAVVEAGGGWRGALPPPLEPLPITAGGWGSPPPPPAAAPLVSP